MCNLTKQFHSLTDILDTVKTISFDFNMTMFSLVTQGLINILDIFTNDLTCAQSYVPDSATSAMQCVAGVCLLLESIKSYLKWDFQRVRYSVSFICSDAHAKSASINCI